MKNDNWLIYLIVAMTSLTTYGLIADGSVFGAVRGVGASVILDGLVIYWEGKRVSCRNAEQREKSKYMMWAGVGILFLFAGGFPVEYSLPSEAVNTLSILGFSVDVTLKEMIVYFASFIIGFWVVLTLGMVLYLRGIDPETAKDIERTKAAQEREDEEIKAYKIANKYTARELGTLKAMELYRKDLEKLGVYTEGEIVRMVENARLETMRQHEVPPAGVAANSVGLNVRAYQAEAQVFTPPSTQPK